MQDAEVDAMQLRHSCSEPECDPCGGKRIVVGRVGLAERDAVVLTDRAQSPFAAPETVELLVEYIWIDDKHPVRSADSVEQRSQSVSLGLAIQDGQVKARVERDHGHTLAQLVGQHGGDLLDRLTRVASLGSRSLGGDAVYSARAGRYLDAGIHQPGKMLGWLTAADEAHSRCDDTIGFGVDPGCLDIKRRKASHVPVHTPTLMAHSDGIRARASSSSRTRAHCSQAPTVDLHVGVLEIFMRLGA